MAEQLEGRARELLEQPNFCMVGSIRRDGSPHLNPTWVHVEDGLVTLNGNEARAWPKNLRRDPRVTLTVLNQENPYEYVEIRGRMVVDTHEGADEHIDQLAKKYMDLDEYPMRYEGEQRILFKVEPEKVIHNSPG